MSLIEGAGGNIVVFPYQATIPGLELLTDITTQDLIDSDPELVADFSAAMSEALDWAAANEDGVRAAIVGSEAPNQFGVLPISRNETALAVGKTKYIGDCVAAVAADVTVAELGGFKAMNETRSPVADDVATPA